MSLDRGSSQPDLAETTEAVESNSGSTIHALSGALAADAWDIIVDLSVQLEHQVGIWCNAVDHRAQDVPRFSSPDS